MALDVDFIYIIYVIYRKYTIYNIYNIIYTKYITRINERMTCPPRMRNRASFCPQIHIFSRSAIPPELHLGKEAIRRAVPFTARKKKW